MDRVRRLCCGAIYMVLLGAAGGCGGTNIPQRTPVDGTPVDGTPVDGSTTGDGELDVPTDRPIDMAAPQPDTDLPDGEAPSCPTGQHLCPVGCVNNDSPQTCGGSCTPCPDPGNGG